LYGSPSPSESPSFPTRRSSDLVAEDLGVDAGAPASRVLELLEDENPSSLGDDEALAAAVEGSACPRRLVVEARGERPHGAEPADAEEADGRLGAAGEHHVLSAVADQHQRFADRVGT